MKIHKIIAKYKGAGSRYKNGNIYALKIIRGKYFTTIWIDKPWYKFWVNDGYLQYERDWFSHNWEVLEQCN